jgi:SNF2 family DNA or RNA helicase
MGEISRQVVREYLAEPKRDSSLVKQFSRKALMRKAKALDVEPVFHTEPRTHQLACFLLQVKYRHYIHLLDMGLGKTWVALNSARYFMHTGRVRRVMVMVPNTANINDWVEQVQKHTPSLRVASLDGGRDGRTEVRDSDAQIVVGTYAGWWTEMCVKAKGRKGKNRLKIHPPTIRRWAKAGFDMMVLDEMNMVANKDSLPHRVCWQLRKHMAASIGLTGTPFAKKDDGPLAVWGQFRIIDGGLTFGEFGLFRGAFFSATKKFFGGYDYKFRKGLRRVFNAFLRNRSVRYRQRECGDLPPLVETPVHVVWPVETWKYYERLLADLYAAKGNFRALKNTWLQMRQTASGFLTVKDPEDEKHVIRFKQNAKKEALLQLLSLVPEHEKVLIFHDFKTTGEIIADVVKEAKLKHLRIVGGQSRKNGVNRDRFVKEPGIRCLISSTAGAYGLNLQVARYVVFYELPNNPLLWQQMLKRAHRMGQEGTVFTWYLLVKNSVEERIYKAGLEGVDLLQALVDGKAKVADVFEPIGDV